MPRGPRLDVRATQGPPKRGEIYDLGCGGVDGYCRGLKSYYCHGWYRIPNIAIISDTSTILDTGAFTGASLDY